MATTAANTSLLLAQMGDVPDERRGAAFVSACALVYRAGDARKETVVRGEWPGSIVRKPRGDGGFGYDPVFLPSQSARTAAELSPEEKDAVSHRGRALAAVVADVAGSGCSKLSLYARFSSKVRTQAQIRRRLEVEPLLDVRGLDLLDDDADQRDGAGQQHADGLADRPAHLDREVGGEEQIDEVHPAVHDGDPVQALDVEDVLHHHLVAERDQPDAGRPRQNAVAQQAPCGWSQRGWSALRSWRRLFLVFLGEVGEVGVVLAQCGVIVGMALRAWVFRAAGRRESR